MNKELIDQAIEYQKRAYVPYSHFSVGAAILCDDGKIYGGCNVESASYGATNCAERTAVFKAVSEGAKKILAVAIVGSEEETFPCGICRQVLREFADDDTPVYLIAKDKVHSYTLGELLPYAFTGGDLL